MIVMPETGVVKQQPRTLTKFIPATTAILDGSGLIDVTSLKGGWVSMPMDDGAIQAVGCQRYYDLSGYTRDDLTFFVMNTTVVENQAFLSTQDSVVCVDLVTKTPISLDAINQDLMQGTPSGSESYCPGFLDSTDDMEQVIFGRKRTYYNGFGQTTILHTQLPLSEQRWGTGQATAGQKIYITRYVLMPVRPSMFVNIPQACYYLTGIPAEEPDLEYIMRLKRSIDMHVVT